MVEFFDSNVLVYYVDTRDARKQAAAEKLVDAALNGDMTCLVAVQTLTEFVNVALNKIMLPHEIVDEYLDVFSELPVIVPDANLVKRGLAIKSRYQIQFYDAMMVAAAERAGASRLYSEDLNDGQLYCGIRAVNPFK